MTGQIGLWIGFTIIILFMLALDLGVFHRKAHAVGVREALIWTAVWIGLALAFNAAVYFWRGPELALQFLTGYLIEKFLSVDNIFVFLMIFSYFAVPGKYQHKVLFWGIIGALLSRAVLIAAGITLIERFHWMVYVFGRFPRAHRHPDGAGEGEGGPAGAQPGGASGPALPADHRAVRGRQVRRAPQWEADVHPRCSWC